MAFRPFSPPSDAFADLDSLPSPYSNTAASNHPPSLSGTASPQLARTRRHRLNMPADPSAVPPPPPPAQDQFITDQDVADSGAEDDEDSDKPKSDKKAGRRKIKIEFIQDKSRRHITFSKRKAGIMKKAYELSTLTGTQVLLLVVSETGLVYTFTTAKLQPLVTQPEGKNLIQACLNAPPGTLPSSMPIGQPLGRNPTMGVPAHHSNVPGGLAIGGGGKEEEGEQEDEGDSRGNKRRRHSTTTQSGGRHGRSGSGAGVANAPPSPHSPVQAMPPSLSIPHTQQGNQHSQQQQQQQQQQPPQIALGPSPTTTSPQQPTSPHYTHASPTHYNAPAQDMYGTQPGLMAPPPGPPSTYPFGTQAGQGAPTHWTHGPGAVQGGYRR